MWARLEGLVTGPHGMRRRACSARSLAAHEDVAVCAVAVLQFRPSCLRFRLHAL